MNEIPQRISESVRRRNPHLYGPGKLNPAPSEMTAGKLIRQSSATAMNKTEAAWLREIEHRYPNFPEVRAQSVKFKLGNGVWYTPDFFAASWPVDGGPAQPTAWEVKGKHVWDDAKVKIKVAASEYPEVRFVLVWRDGQGWREQAVLA